MIQLTDIKRNKEMTHTHKIWIGIMVMDVKLLELLLEDVIEYEDISKSAFIKKLKDRFIEHSIQGDTELLMDFATCFSCNCPSPVCKFVGHNSGVHFALFFEEKDEEILDIYH